MITAHDDMIFQGNAEYIAGLPYPMGQTQIRLAGCGITAGVIMYKDDGNRFPAYGFYKNFSGISLSRKYSPFR